MNGEAIVNTEAAELPAYRAGMELHREAVSAKERGPGWELEISKCGSH